MEVGRVKNDILDLSLEALGKVLKLDLQETEIIDAFKAEMKSLLDNYILFQ